MKTLKKKGFTIVELVIVIAVIAVLAAVLIPTFSSLIKKANMSADQVAVKNMNTILETDEVLNGKPATVVDVQKVLKANGVSDFIPFDVNNAFYWLAAENLVILWDGEENKVTYPDEMAKKFKNVTEPSAAWDLLSTVFDDAKYVEIQQEEGKTLKDVLLDAIENAEDGSILKLPSNSSVNLAVGGLYWLGQAMQNDGGTGKEITIDLNGSTISSTGSNAVFVKDSEGNWVKDEDGDYQMNIIEVPANGELVLTNGTINIEHGNRPTLASIMTGSGSKLVVSDVVMNTSTAGIMPAGDASEVVIENSTINALNYALGTNRMESNAIKIIINNSSLSATYSTAVLINAPSDTHIYNSTITGIVHGIALRSGSLTVENSTIITTDKEPGIYSFKDFASGYNFNGYWHSGNTLPAGTIVLGDYAEANADGSFSYSGNVSCTLINTKLQSADSNEIPEVLLAASDPAKQVSLSYDDASTIGSVKVYGKDWTPTNDNIDVTISNKGTIKVNGVVTE